MIGTGPQRHPIQVHFVHIDALKYDWLKIILLDMTHFGRVIKGTKVIVVIKKM